MFSSLDRVILCRISKVFHFRKHLPKVKKLSIKGSERMISFALNASGIFQLEEYHISRLLPCEYILSRKEPLAINLIENSSYTFIISINCHSKSSPFEKITFLYHSNESFLILLKEPFPKSSASTYINP